MMRAILKQGHTPQIWNTVIAKCRFELSPKEFRKKKEKRKNIYIYKTYLLLFIVIIIFFLLHLSNKSNPDGMFNKCQVICTLCMVEFNY